TLARPSVLASRIAVPCSLAMVQSRCEWSRMPMPALNANAKPQATDFTTLFLRRKNYGKANRTRGRVAAGDLARRELVGGCGEGNSRPQRPKRSHREEIRIAYDHQGRGHRCERDRTPGRP